MKADAEGIVPVRHNFLNDHANLKKLSIGFQWHIAQTFRSGISRRNMVGFSQNYSH